MEVYCGSPGGRQLNVDEIDESVIENERLGIRRRSDRELAEALTSSGIKVSARTIRRRRAAIRLSAPERLNDAFFKDIPLSAISSRGKSVRLPDGSWEKITYAPGAVEREEARRLSYDDLTAVFDKPVKPAKRVSKEGTFVLCLADFQVGKVSQGGGSAELVARALKMLHQAADELTGCEELIIADLGDSNEGFWNVVTQAQTNDLSLTDQIRVVQRLYAEAIRLFAPKAKAVTYVAVPSNHCAVRTSMGSRNRANAPDDDFGLLIAYNLGMVLEGRKEYAHVQFVTPEKWEEALTVKTHDDSHVAFTHGHLAGKQQRVAQWFADLAFGHRSGLEKADVLVHGHFHNFSVGLTGDNRFIIGCPSADNGSDWFTNVSGKRTDPALLSFWVRDHKAEDWKLYYG